MATPLGRTVRWAIDPPRHWPSRQGGLIRPALWMGSSRISPFQPPCQDQHSDWYIKWGRVSSGPSRGASRRALTLVLVLYLCRLGRHGEGQFDNSPHKFRPDHDPQRGEKFDQDFHAAIRRRKSGEVNAPPDLPNRSFGRFG